MNNNNFGENLVMICMNDGNVLFLAEAGFKPETILLYHSGRRLSARF